MADNVVTLKVDMACEVSVAELIAVDKMVPMNVLYSTQKYVVHF